MRSALAISGALPLLLCAPLIFYPWNEAPFCADGDLCLRCPANGRCEGGVPRLDSEFRHPAMPPEYLEKLMAAMRRALAQKPQDDVLTLVYIGANDFREFAQFYAETFRGVAPGRVRYILFEPNKALHPAIDKSVADAGLSGTTIVHGAVGGHDLFARLSLWWFQTHCVDAVLDALDASMAARVRRLLGYWTSFDENRLRAVLVLPFFTDLFPEPSLQARLRESLTECVEPLDVPVYTPRQIFEEFGLKPESVDVLVCDAEGFDVSIVNAFLAVGSFRPRVLQFEWTGYTSCCSAEELRACMQLIAARGYDVHQDHQDMCAIRQW